MLGVAWEWAFAGLWLDASRRAPPLPGGGEGALPGLQALSVPVCPSVRITEHLARAAKSPHHSEEGPARGDPSALHPYLRSPPVSNTLHAGPQGVAARPLPAGPSVGVHTTPAAFWSALSSLRFLVALTFLSPRSPRPLHGEGAVVITKQVLKFARHITYTL